MGRGDRRTKKGKIFARSYGNSRPRKEHLTIAEATQKQAAKKAALASAASVAAPARTVPTS